MSEKRLSAFMFRGGTFGACKKTFGSKYFLVVRLKLQRICNCITIFYKAIKRAFFVHEESKAFGAYLINVVLEYWFWTGISSVNLEKKHATSFDIFAISEYKNLGLLFYFPMQLICCFTE